VAATAEVTKVEGKKIEFKVAAKVQNFKCSSLRLAVVGLSVESLTQRLVRDSGSLGTE
jgi:predicted thioesterase